MAARAVEMTKAERAAAALVAVVLLAPLGSVIWRAGGMGVPGAADWAALRFTLVQAVLSACVSVGLAIPVARALARRQFVGRGVLITLLGAPFILPVIVAVIGLLAVFGQAGLINQGLALLGLGSIRIYGLQGVVLAHVFFNLPLATRMILQGWQAIPAERFRLAASLGMGPGQVSRVLEWPMLRSVLPGAWMIIFALCLSSFAVVLTLGGGPKATTLELGIYQAFTFDFDLGRAAGLAMVQLVLAGAAAGVALWVAPPLGFGAGLDRVVQRWEAQSGWLRAMDAGVMALAAAFLLVPLAMVVLGGLEGLGKMPGTVWAAAQVSVFIALSATALTTGLALVLARKAELVGYLGLAISPMVIGTGLFLLINPVADPRALAFLATVLVNALMALPFAVRILGPELRQIDADYGRLAASLGLRGWARLRWLILPRMRKSLGFSAGLTAALSMGDLGVVTLFAGHDWATLPLEMYRLMAAYRMDAAAGAGLLLLAISLALFWVFDRGGRSDVDA